MGKNLLFPSTAQADKYQPGLEQSAPQCLRHKVKPHHPESREASPSLVISIKQFFIFYLLTISPRARGENSVAGFGPDAPQSVKNMMP